MNPDQSQFRSFPSLSIDHSNPWPTTNDSPFINDHHHLESSFENFNDARSQPRRTRKHLFADPLDHMAMPAGPSLPGPSSLPFYNEPRQPSDVDPFYSLDRPPMFSLKRKRENSPEPNESWLAHPTPMSMPMHDIDDQSPYAMMQDRKGKGKESDYKGKGKQRESNSEHSPIFVSDSPINDVLPLAPTSTRIPSESKAPSEPLATYTCPICFSAPTNATLTPCGHICCGECLFTAVKTVMHRSQQAAAPDANQARCPVCRALIPDWDGKGAGVIGLKARAIFSF